jgi:hypothetical protein
MNKNSFIEDDNSILSGVIYSHRMYRVDKWKEIVMKKQIGLMLMLMIAVFAFAACGASKSGTDNSEIEEATKDMKVKSIEFQSLSMTATDNM